MVARVLPDTHAGIGLRAPHYREMLERLPDVGFLEVHSENYFGAGGQPHRFLSRLREHYPLSLHGVGLSLGSADGLDRGHLSRLKELVARYEPAAVSEHIAWGRIGGRHANGLLPLPYTEEALDVVVRNIRIAQDFLGRRILVENVSSYLRFRHETLPEWEFVAETVRASGCGLLLDVNNLYVNAVNHGFDPASYLDAMPGGAVEEIHLAGFDDTGPCLIDTHGRPVCVEVWRLYSETLRRFGPRPTLIEWDTDLPPLSTLLAEAAHAQSLIDASQAPARQASAAAPGCRYLSGAGHA
jgi:uncharacterized protein (UPF0276 family)